MQKSGAVKDFYVLIYYTKTFYCLYISKTFLSCVFVWAACGSDVIV